LFVSIRTNYSTDLIKFGGKVAHGARKTILDFGGNPNYDTLGIGLR